MEETVNAIVLKKQPQGESDLRLTLFTLERGKLFVVAKGARKSTSRLRGIAEPLSAAYVTFAAGKKQRFVTQAQPVRLASGVRDDYDRLNVALGVAEIVSELAQYEKEEPEMFALFQAGISEIATSKKPAIVAIFTELKLLMLSGFMPSFMTCVECGARANHIEEAFSSTQGGFVCQKHSAELRDRIVVRFEVLVGLDKLKDLDAPPVNLKFAVECYQLLTKLWRACLETPLPQRSFSAESLTLAKHV
jgi:DNA repair protein RecO (recombination protein O)